MKEEGIYMSKINMKLDKQLLDNLNGSLSKSVLGDNKKLLGLFELINNNKKDDKIDTKEIKDFANSIFESDTKKDGEVDMQELDVYINNNLDMFKKLKIKAKDIINFIEIFVQKASLDNELKSPLELINEKGFSESERAELLNLLKNYDIEYINKVFSIDFLDSDNIENINGNRKFSASELIMFFNLSEDKQAKIISFIEKGTVNVAKYSINQILVLINFEEAMKIDVLNHNEKISYSYNERTKLLSIPDKNNANIKYVYSPTYKNGIYEQIIEDNENNQITIINNKNHIKQNVKYIMPELSPIENIIGNPEKLRVYNNETIDICDENWNVMQSIVRSSSDIAGIQNITTEGQGIIDIKSEAKIDENNNTIITKSLTSPLGDKTAYSYKKSKDGKIFEVNYIITDKNNNILYKRDQSISLISDNEYLHNINGEEYNVTFEQDFVTVHRVSDNKTITINLKNLVDSEGYETTLEIIKTFPADRLWAMNQISLKSIHYDEDDSKHFSNNGQFFGEQKTIVVGKQYAENNIFNTVLSTLIHEFCHYLDSDIETGETGVIGKNQEVINTFKTEYDEFLQYTTSLQQEYISYFTTNNRAATERTAETNLLITAHQFDERDSSRALYYSVFFPRTIACIAKMVDSRCINLV